MLAELTFRQEVRLAVIQGLVVLLGVLIGLGAGLWQASRQRGHERELERDRFLLAERTAVYRRLVAAAGQALNTALFAAGRARAITNQSSSSGPGTQTHRGPRHWARVS